MRSVNFKNKEKIEEENQKDSIIESKRQEKEKIEKEKILEKRYIK